MEIFILNEKFEKVYVLDTFESFIWTERYNGYGDFEFYTPLNQDLLNIIHEVQKNMQKTQQKNYYISLKNNSTIMIIEKIEITTDVEDGSKILISGRGLESILDRRIIWPSFTFHGNLQDGIKKLLDQNMINSQTTFRNISNFKFNISNNEYINKLEFQAQYTGDNLYDTILSICNSFGLGFDVELDSDNNFVLLLKYGEDRSYDQNKNSYVIFSNDYENIINSDYLESTIAFKNSALVAGEGEGLERRFRTVYHNSILTIGLSRREMYVDARDIQSSNQNEAITDEQYMALLAQRGYEKLEENPYIKAFTGEMDANNMFIYGRDFFKGDLVQIRNEYGMETKARIEEVIISLDNNGYRIYPTFKTI